MNEFGADEWMKSSLQWFEEAKKQAGESVMWEARCRAAEYWTHREEVEAAHAENKRLTLDRDGWIKRALDAEAEVNRLKRE